MMGARKLITILITLSCSPLLAHAGVAGKGGAGDLKTYAKCGQGKIKRFEIRGTAVTSYIQGILYAKDNSFEAVNYSCKRVEAQSNTSNLVFLKCSGVNDRRLLARVEVGVTGIPQVIFSLEQIYPLAPQDLTAMVCRIRN